MVDTSTRRRLKNASALCALCALVACGPAKPLPRPAVVAPAAAAAASSAASAGPPSPSPAPGDVQGASRAARLAEQIARGESVGLDVGGLDAREREELASRVDALLGDAPPTLPIRPVLGALARAWGPRAEAIVARYLVHHDHALAEHARLILRARGLSSAAVASSMLAREPDPDARANVADAVSRAPDASVVSVEQLCRPVPSSSDAGWLCAAALSRLGSAAARASLVAKTKALCASAPYDEVVARFAWLAAEVGRRGPWRELGDQIRNTRAAPIVLCGDNFDERADSGCKTVGHGPPIGDAFLREVVGVYGLKVSFALDEKSFTNAQRSEVLRLLAAAPPSGP